MNTKRFFAALAVAFIAAGNVQGAWINTDDTRSERADREAYLY